MKMAGRKTSQALRRILCCCIPVALLAGFGGPAAFGWRLGDAVRMKNEVTNDLVGMGLVVGLNGTGDGGDFLPSMRPLEEMMKRFDDRVQLDREMKNVNNVAIVLLSVEVPALGAHFGDHLDVKVSALAAKSLEKGNLFLVPMYAPRADVKMVLASAEGMLTLPDDKHPTQAVIKGGCVLIEDVLPEEIKDNTFTFVLLTKWASREMASAIAEQINEEVAPETEGKPIAVAEDGTSVKVTIPQAERANPTPFIARLQGLRLPDLPGPAKVVIDHLNKTIVCTGEVEVSTTLVSQGNLTVTIGQPENPAGSKVPFVALDPKKVGNARMKDLQDALNLLKVSADERIAIMEALHDANALKADVIDTNLGMNRK